MLYKRIYRSFITIFLLWGFGFLSFCFFLPSPQDKTSRTDAIIVLTGGKNRISAGIELLKNNLAHKMFVSGVNETVKKKEELLPIQQSSYLMERIELGYSANNTQENAQEVQAWVQQNKYRSVRLVTSDYHIWRSLLEIKFVLPHIHVILHPVPSLHKKIFWQKILILAQEYHKSMAVLIRYILSQLFGALS